MKHLKQVEEEEAEVVCSLNVKQRYLRLRDRNFASANSESQALHASLISAERKAKKLAEENAHILDLIIRSNLPSLTDYSSDSTTTSDSDTEEQQRRTAEEEKEALQNATEDSQKRKLSPESAAHLEGQTAEDALYGEDDAENGQRGTKKVKRQTKVGKKTEQPISFDADGNPILPAELGRGSSGVTLVSLGQTQPGRETFASTRYIFPVGYTSHKTYASLIDTKKKAVYQNEIVDGGDAPLFKVTFLEDPSRTFTHVSSSGVWKKILDELTAMGYSAKTHASGPDFFGLSNPTIGQLIRRLPGAEQCFEEFATRKSSQAEKQVSSRSRRGTSSGNGGSRTTKGTTAPSLPAPELDPRIGMIAVPNDVYLSHEMSPQPFPHQPHPAHPVYFDHRGSTAGTLPAPGTHPLGHSLARLQQEEYNGPMSDDENEEYSSTFSFPNPAASLPVYVNQATGAPPQHMPSFMPPPSLIHPLHPSGRGFPIPVMPMNLSMMDSGDGYLRVGNDWTGRGESHQNSGDGR